MGNEIWSINNDTYTSLVHEKIVCFLSRRELGMPVLRLAMEAKWGFEWENNFNLVLKLKIWTIFELRKKKLFLALIVLDF